MSDNNKKIILIAVAVLALGIGIFVSWNMLKEPKLEAAYSIGGGKPGHGMKAQEKAEEQKAAQNANPPADAGGADPLAGPNPGATAGGPGVPSGKDR